MRMCRPMDALSVHSSLCCWQTSFQRVSMGAVTKFILSDESILAISWTSSNTIPTSACQRSISFGCPAAGLPPSVATDNQQLMDAG